MPDLFLKGAATARTFETSQKMQQMEKLNIKEQAHETILLKSKQDAYEVRLKVHEARLKKAFAVKQQEERINEIKKKPLAVLCAELKQEVRKDYAQYGYYQGEGGDEDDFVNEENKRKWEKDHYKD